MTNPQKFFIWWTRRSKQNFFIVIWSICLFKEKRTVKHKQKINHLLVTYVYTYNRGKQTTVIIIVCSYFQSKYYQLGAIWKSFERFFVYLDRNVRNFKVKTNKGYFTNPCTNQNWLQSNWSLHILRFVQTHLNQKLLM